ncbi:MAG: hypothetical protein WBC97_03940 [Gemmatimonadales bacterium]
MTDLTALAAVLLLASTAAVWSYYRWERLGRRAWPLAACRAVALSAVGVLLLDLSCGIHPASSAPLVLLDGSLSMAASGGPWQVARDSAQRWGTVQTFGDVRVDDPMPDRGASRLGPALVAAVATGRPIVVVTDGEIDDAAELPVALLGSASIRVFSRRTVPDVAVLALAAPERASLGDTLDVDVIVGRWGGAPDSVQLTLAADRPIATRTIRFGGADRREVRFRVPARQLGAGDPLVRATVRSTADSEPGDDERWALVHVAATPGIVVVAAPPDWGSRQLVRTLGDVSDLPVRAFVRMGARWWTADALKPVSESAVLQAARQADLLVTTGDPGPVFARSQARARWRWPSGADGSPPLPGDWYVSAAAPSPLAGAWTAIPVDSLPPLVEVDPMVPAAGQWVGLSARNRRQGTDRAVILGRESDGRRELQMAGSGFWRWAFSGGTSEEAYRGLVASAAAWLLGATDPRTGAARPVERVVSRGVPITFEWTAHGIPVSLVITWASDSVHRTDTLRFDGARRASVLLPVGRYRYHLADGGSGAVAVEPWSPEFVPRAASLTSRAASVAVVGAPRAARDRLWTFVLALAAFSAEWALRRRRGLR